MKILKKIVSCLMAAVVAFTTAVCLTVGAGAEDKSYIVRGVYNDEGQYCVFVDGIPFDALNSAGLYDIVIWLYFSDKYFQAMTSRTTTYCNVFDNNNNVISQNIMGTAYYNSDWQSYGFAFFLPPGSPYVEELTAEKEVVISVVALTYDAGGNVIPYTVAPDNTAKEGVLYFTIKPEWNTEKQSVGNKDVSVLNCEEIADMAYTGKSLKPDVVIKDRNKTLKKDVDYTLSYKNNKKIGTATVTIKGIGEYTGKKKITFRIVPKKTTLTAEKSGKSVKLSWKAAKGAEKYEIYYSENGGEFKKLTSVSSSRTSYSTTKLDLKKNKYEFKIRSYAEVKGKKYYSEYSKTVKLK